MVLGDGIRRNIAYVDPSERAMLRDALIELNHRFFPGNRNDSVPGGVSFWFKQDEIHHATHVHQGPEFIPWHRDIVNRLEQMLREINPQLSLHYWDWKQDPRNIPEGNLGGGQTGPLSLFTKVGQAEIFMGYGGLTLDEIGEPWKSAGYYVPGASPDRDSSGNPADPPLNVVRLVDGSPVTQAEEDDILDAVDYHDMRVLLEDAHDNMHGFVMMGSAHISFRDPFVFLLHSNVDRIFARWQTDPAHPERLDPNQVYGSESNADVPVGQVIQNLNNNVEPWSTGHSFDIELGQEHFTRPWYAPENQGEPHNYKHTSIIHPPCYDTNYNNVPIVQIQNMGDPPVINFNDIPSGDTVVRAAVFRVYSCVNATIQVKPGEGPSPPFSIHEPPSGSITVTHELKPYVEKRIWLSYTAGTAWVPVPDGAVTFECVESGQQFTFILKANAIVRPRVAVMLALDQSGSMDYSAGTSGLKRIDVLKDSAKRFMDVIPANSGVGLIRFDTDAYLVTDPNYPGFPVTRITTNEADDPDRKNARDAVDAHLTNVNGATSVGDGLLMAKTVLDAVPAADYEHKAIIVFTDGLENRPLSIADVMSPMDNQTFAIGLGNETQVNTNALKTLTNSTGGYLLLSGILTSNIDDFFRVSKYFWQILAGVTNNNIILDPTGFIAPGSKVKIPFYLNEADIDATIILFSDAPVIDIFLETPGGMIIDPTNVAGLGIDYASSDTTKNYRFNLPIATSSGNHTGVWNIILKVNEKDYKKQLSKFKDNRRLRQTFETHGARYSVVANTYSNLRMNVTLDQNSFEPGAYITLRSVLTEYQLRVEKRSSVDVQIMRPDRTISSLMLNEIEPGIFENSFKASGSGIYACRFLAKGASLRGSPFTREQTLHGAVFNGGDRPSPLVPPFSVDFCSLVMCLLDDKSIQRYLKEASIDPTSIIKCIEKICRKSNV